MPGMLAARLRRVREWAMALRERLGERVRGLPRWVRRAVAGVAVLALVAVGAVQGHHAKPSAHPAPNGPAPPVAQFTGPALTERTGLRLLLAGYQITELELDTGQRRPVLGVPPTPNGYRMVRTDGGAVLARAQGICRLCPGPVYVIPPGALSGIPLRGWDIVVPGAQPDRLWGYRRANGALDSAGTVRELDLAGNPVGPPYRLGDPFALFGRATIAGLLMLHGDRAQIVDPRTGATRYDLGWVLAATADRVAWVEPSCRANCPLRVLDLRTGRTTGHPTAGRPVGGAFGPDGGIALSVAVPKHTANTAGGADLDGATAVQAYLLAGDTMRPLSTPVAGMSLDWSGNYLVLATVGGLITDGPPTLSAAVTANGWPQPHKITLSGLVGAQLMPR
jgi:hypothetical protein